MRAVLPIRCPKCGFESQTLSECTFCGSALRDAQGHVMPPLYARVEGRAQRELAKVVGLGATGTAMILATLLAHGPILAPIAIGALTGLGVWSLVRRGQRNAVPAWMRDALAAARAPTGIAAARDGVEARRVVTGRVRTLRSVLAPEGIAVAAFRQRETLERAAPRELGRAERRSVVVEARETHRGGRFAVVGTDEVAVVDDDWLLLLVAEEPPSLFSGASLVTVTDDDEVTVVGPAARGPAEDAGRFATAVGYREAGDALVFDGREGAPVVVIVSAAGSRRAAR